MVLAASRKRVPSTGPPEKPLVVRHPYWAISHPIQDTEYWSFPSLYTGRPCSWPLLSYGFGGAAGPSGAESVSPRRMQADKLGHRHTNVLPHRLRFLPWALMIKKLIVSVPDKVISVNSYEDWPHDADDGRKNAMLGYFPMLRAIY